MPQHPLTRPTRIPIHGELRHISCRRHGDLFVVNVGSTTAFHLDQDEATEFAEMLEAEVTYHDMEVELLGRTVALDTPIEIADVSLTQQEARLLLAELQSLLDQSHEPMWHRVNWQEEGF